ncbi:MAG: BrnT family toxin [Burkholderiaceae bacterium]|jgi:uncharacterized DUF497 family protein|nr:BrnT family toxin [Burkholderiaceae bacterium]
MYYKWDEAKRAANMAKHGVDFADAVGALEDPLGCTFEDADAQGEARFVSLGYGFCGRILYVVWTECGADTIRIISARKASPGEARHYRE